MDEKKNFLQNLGLVKGKMKLYRYINYFFNLFTSAFNAACTFIFPFANTLFQSGNEKWGIVLLCVGTLQSSIYQVIFIFQQNINIEYGNYIEISSAQKSTDILTTVRNKVYQKDENGKNILSEPVELMTNIYEYIKKKVMFRDLIVSFVLGMLIYMGTIIGAIKVTAANSSNLPIVTIVMAICMFVIVYITVRQIKRRKEYFSKERQRINKLNVSKEDVLNVIPINPKHSNYLIDNYVSSKKIVADAQKKLTMKEIAESALKNFAMGISTTILVLVALFSYEKIDVGVFATAITLGVMYSSLVRTLTNEVQEVQRVMNSYTEYKSYLPIMDGVAQTYIELKGKEKSINDVNEIKLSNFCFEHKNDNEKTHKIYTADLKISKGTINLLYGESGSGKSTLLKILTGIYLNPEKNICINGNQCVNFIENSIIYDPKSQLGKNSILQEITFCENVADVDKNKLIEILKGLNLYGKLSSKNEDVIEFLSNERKDIFSDGQLQRLVLARMLYNIEENNMVLVFDEPTANLDYFTAQKVIEFIVSYCNKQKERLIIISSHQLDIVENYCNEKFKFKKEKENYFIIEKS